MQIQSKLTLKNSSSQNTADWLDCEGRSKLLVRYAACDNVPRRCRLSCRLPHAPCSAEGMPFICAYSRRLHLRPCWVISLCFAGRRTAWTAPQQLRRLSVQPRPFFAAAPLHRTTLREIRLASSSWAQPLRRALWRRPPPPARGQWLRPCHAPQKKNKSAAGT
jgi:hypothetical protein